MVARGMVTPRGNACTRAYVEPGGSICLPEDRWEGYVEMRIGILQCCTVKDNEPAVRRRPTCLLHTFLNGRQPLASGNPPSSSVLLQIGLKVMGQG